MTMLTCPNPVCKKSLTRLNRQCPHCRTDLGLLVDYVDHLQVALERADALTRAGQLGEAIWAYLEVLEVDPDNATARRQVGKVVTAVRQFDQAAPGRRWLHRLRRQDRFRRQLRFWEDEQTRSRFGMAALILVLTAVVFIAGFWWGYLEGQPKLTPQPPAQQQEPSKDDKLRLEGLELLKPPAGKE